MDLRAIVTGIIRTVFTRLTWTKNVFRWICISIPMRVPLKKWFSSSRGICLRRGCRLATLSRCPRQRSDLPSLLRARQLCPRQRRWKGFFKTSVGKSRLEQSQKQSLLTMLRLGKKAGGHYDSDQVCIDARLAKQRAVHPEAKPKGTPPGLVGAAEVAPAKARPTLLPRQEQAEAKGEGKGVHPGLGGIQAPARPRSRLLPREEQGDVQLFPGKGKRPNSRAPQPRAAPMHQGKGKGRGKGYSEASSSSSNAPWLEPAARDTRRGAVDLRRNPNAPATPWEKRKRVGSNDTERGHLTRPRGQSPASDGDQALSGWAPSLRGRRTSNTAKSSSFSAGAQVEHTDDDPDEEDVAL